MRQRWLALATLGLLAATAGADELKGAAAGAFTIATFQDGLGQVTDFRFVPDGRVVIINKTGTVFVRPAAGGALVTAGSFSVDSSSEKGLLGLAVTPDFATSRDLVFYYSASDAAGGTDANRHRVVKRKLGADSKLEAGEVLLLDKLRGPANHDGGAVDIGKDGMLYVGDGDTGCNSGLPPEPTYTPTNFYGTCLSDDPTENGAGNGKIHRIALDGTIPPSNPLASATNVTACGQSCGDAIGAATGAPRKSLFAWGFRNPFRIWSDPVTNKLWVGDVGEVTYEEINIVKPGRHHGWPFREGAHGFPVTKCHDVRVGTSGGAPVMDQDCVDPVYYCEHGTGGGGVDGDCTSITGGLIVDSCTWPDAFRGKYLFGDNSTGAMWTLTPNPARDGVTGARADFAQIDPGTPVAIRTGNDGALYVAALPGRIVRIAPTSPLTCNLGSDAGTSVDGAVSGDGGKAGGSSDGCGCSSGGRGAPSGGVLALALGGLVMAWRRRRLRA